jgi:epoxyqueuosine reductase
MESHYYGGVLKSTSEELLAQLKERGYRGRSVPIQHLHDLQEEIKGRHEQGLLDEEFYQERLAWFDFRPPNDLPEAASLIVVAVPSPQTLVIFTRNGEPRPLILPPTYVGYNKIQQLVQDLVASLLAPAGFHVARTALPLKLLAVHSGLGKYGRNNICYVPGMGSFHQLVAVYSDLPCEQDIWQEPQMMASCQNCHACLNHCPTGAIPSDRFLLRAERCLVFHNERPGSVAFPSWIAPSWHNCLIGCMACQRICPQDKDFIPWVEGHTEFSQEETELLLDKVPLAQLPSVTTQKLEQLDLLDSLDILPRNLSVFLQESKGVSAGSTSGVDQATTLKPVFPEKTEV